MRFKNHMIVSEAHSLDTKITFQTKAHGFRNINGHFKRHDERRHINDIMGSARERVKIMWENSSHPKTVTWDQNRLSNNIN